ncbi:MAG: hypothetical protein ACRD3W_03070, partial [Terriglobales bacterium]
MATAKRIITRKLSDEAPLPRHMVVIAGYGDANYNFPEPDELVLNALARLTSSGTLEEEGESGTKKTARRKTKRQPRRGRLTLPFVSRERLLAMPVKTRKATASPAPAAADSTTGGAAVTFDIAANTDHTFLVGAEGMRLELYSGRFAAIVADRFDPLAGAVAWARGHMDEKYQPAVESLSKQLDQLQQLYEEALPKVLAVAEAQNQDVPKSALLQAAVQALDEELAEIIYVLRTWTDAFAQFRDGMYEQLKAVTYTVEEAFRLLLTGDAEGDCEGSPKCKAKLKSEIFHIGNRFLARFSDDGPATLPGRGPVGFHLIEVPHDERSLLSLMLVLYLHEFRHDVFADIEGLADEVTETVLKAIARVCKSGAVK